MHIAAAGGVWQALVFGFGGVRDFTGELSITPHLPAAWRMLEFSLRVRDRQLRIRLEHGLEQYLLETGEPLELQIRGQLVVLERGRPHVVVAGLTPVGPH